MHITLDEFRGADESDTLCESNVEPGILGADEYGEALMESLGSIKPAKSDPDFIKIIKAEMRRSGDISSKSQVIPIKGDGPSELYSDISSANGKGTPSFIYVNTHRRATYIHVDAYGEVTGGSPVVFFNDIIDEEESDAHVEANLGLKPNRPKFRNGRLAEVIGRLNYSRGYAGIIVLAAE